MSSYDDRPGQSHRDHRYDDPDATTYTDTAVLDREHPSPGGYGADPDLPVAAPVEPKRWNSGADLGLLLLRLVVGGIFIAHGGQKVFGWFAGPGLDGFAGDLTEAGFSQSDVLAAVTGFTELVGGVLVVLGLFTPLAAAGLLGVMINVVWLKWYDGLFAVDGGFELELTLGAGAAALVLAGPGRAALDNGRAWFRHSVVTGWVCLLLGVGAAVAVRLLFHS